MLKSQGGPLVHLCSSASRRIAPLFWNHNFSGSCSFVACDSLCLSQPVPADVAGPLDVLGHHRSACAVVGTLGRSGFPLENAAARICREAGGRVRTNVLVRDLDLGVVDQFVARRIQVVVDELLLFQEAQLAVDTTLVCPLTWEGEAKPRTATTSGKEARYPELAGNGGRARLVVLAGEVGGRFSDETGLASAKVREVPQILQGRAHAAWMRRWSSILACAVARAFALSLLDRDCSTGVDGHTPSVDEVLGDSRHFE